MTNDNKKRRPEFQVYHATKSANGKNYYASVGAVWTHSEGEGFTIRLDMIPVHSFDGNLVAFPPREDDEEATAE